MVLTKENPIEHSIINYTSGMLDMEIRNLKLDHHKLFDIANGPFEDAPRCEKCDWCIATKKTNIIEANEWSTA